MVLLIVEAFHFGLKAVNFEFGLSHLLALLMELVLCDITVILSLFHLLLNTIDQFVL